MSTKASVRAQQSVALLLPDQASGILQTLWVAGAGGHKRLCCALRQLPVSAKAWAMEPLAQPPARPVPAGMGVSISRALQTAVQQTVLRCSRQLGAPAGAEPESVWRPPREPQRGQRAALALRPRPCRAAPARRAPRQQWLGLSAALVACPWPALSTPQQGRPPQRPSSPLSRQPGQHSQHSRDIAHAGSRRRLISIHPAA